MGENDFDPQNLDPEAQKLMEQLSEMVSEYLEEPLSQLTEESEELRTRLEEKFGIQSRLILAVMMGLDRNFKKPAKKEDKKLTRTFIVDANGSISILDCEKDWATMMGVKISEEEIKETVTSPAAEPEMGSDWIKSLNIGNLEGLE